MVEFIFTSFCAETLSTGTFPSGVA